MAETVAVEGLKELVNALRRVDREHGPAMRQGLNTAIQPVLTVAKARVPRRTGRLGATIRPASTQRVGRVAAGYAKVPYAGPIHFGWPRRNIRAQPFLTDALHQSEALMVSILQREVEKLLDRAFAQMEGT